MRRTVLVALLGLALGAAAAPADATPPPPPVPVLTRETTDLSLGSCPPSSASGSTRRNEIVTSSSRVARETSSMSGRPCLRASASCSSIRMRMVNTISSARVDTITPEPNSDGPPL